jgi:protein-L-isoaspartate(D-aspartate) O-methyltransferase
VQGRPPQAIRPAPQAPLTRTPQPQAPLTQAPQARGPVQQAPRTVSQGPIVVLVTAGLGLFAVLGVFILGDLRAKIPSEAAVSAPSVEPAVTPVAAPAPKAEHAAPAPQPAPLPATAQTPPAAKAPSPTKAPAPLPLPLPRSAAVLDSAEPPFDITNRQENPPTTDRASYVAWMRAHTDQKEKFLLQKWELAQNMLRFRSLTRTRVLEAILRTPREFFCRDTRRAYEDAVLPIGYGQTISGPHMVARMTDYLDPQPEHKVLEIGTGSGYQSAVLSELSNHVYTIEIVEPLARETDAIYRLHEQRYPEYRNIHRRVDDGYLGWPQNAPFDRIIVTCGIDHVPPELLHELAPEGIMVIPVGPPSGQTILRIVKHVGADGTVRLDREDIFQGKRRQIFVPFTSKQGGLHVLEDKKETR